MLGLEHSIVAESQIYISDALREISVVEPELETIAVVGTEPVLESEEHAEFNLSAINRLGSFIDNLIVINYREGNDAVARMNDAVMVIGLGVPTDAPEVYGENLARRRVDDYAFVDETGTDVFGICVVHQIIAEMRGIDVADFGRVENGIVLAEAHYYPHPIFKGLPPEFEVFSDHWAEASSTPKGYRRLMSTMPGPFSEHGCTEAAFESLDGRVVTTQFHAEENDNGLLMIRNKYDQALERLLT